MAELTWFEQVLFIRLIVSADDYGRYDARPQILKGSLFPFDDITVVTIQKAITKLSTNGMISLYEVAGKPYLELCAWRKYNTPRAKESKYPEKPICEQMQADENNCKQALADSPDIRSSIFDIRNSEFDIREVGPPAAAPKSKKEKFSIPSVEEVRQYCREHKYAVEPERFCNYYESNGWRVGKNPMKDWKAAVRTWAGSPIQHGPGVPKGASGQLGEAELEAIQRVLKED